MSIARLVGLTGGIASGKSVVSQLWQEAGALVVDTDVISRQLTAEGGAALPALRSSFGDGFFDGDKLRREQLRQWVFEHPSERLKLEAVLHPLIRQHSLEQLAAPCSSYRVLVIPLLHRHSDWLQHMSHVVAVDCPVAMQLQRLVQHRGLSLEQGEKIIHAQISRAERLAFADVVISNHGGIEQLHQRAEAVHRFLLKR